MLLILIKTLYVITHTAIGMYDFAFYRIPNTLLGVLLVLYGLYAPFFMGGEVIINSLIIFVVALAVGFGLFMAKVIGGGDAKYIAVASLWMNTNDILQFIFFVAFVGGLLAIIYLILRDYVMRFSDVIWLQIQKAEARVPLLRGVWLGSEAGFERKRENISSRMVPYGIAIATAAIMVFVIMPLVYG